MFTKHKFKIDVLVAICGNYGKWSISIVKSTIPLTDPFVAKVWILALLYKSTP